MSSFGLPQLNPARIRSYVLRIPLCTRIIVAAILLFCIGGIWGGFAGWARLEPKAVFQGGAHRLSTYPFLHLGFVHLLANVISLVPLLERFESEHGTLVAVALFTGPFTTFPGVAYTLLCNFVLRSNTAICGASIWTFLLLTSSTVHLSRGTPYIAVATYRIPTLALPFIGILVTHFIVPHTSLLGHVCGALMGWAWGAGWLKFLVPPEKALRWVENKANLLARLPHYVSVDQKTYGRYGVLPMTANGSAVELGLGNGGGRRLGP